MSSSAVALAAGVVVGGVLLASGALKLADPGWRPQALGFGLPRPLVLLVPIVELVVGATVAAGVAEPWSGLVAAALLGAFTVFLLGQLLRGQRPPCACFGRLSARPISWWSVVRNVVLMVLALVAALA